MSKLRRCSTVVSVLLVASLLLAACDATAPSSSGATPSPALPTIVPGSLSDAAIIVDRAAHAANAPLFQSVALTYTMRTSDGGVDDQARLWYQTTNRWRLQSHYRLVANPGPSPLQVSDGTTFWRYDPVSSFVNITSVADALAGNDAPLYSLARTFKSADCPAPRLIGQDAVAGRPAYVVELGPDRCVQASRPGAVDWVVWIDQQTFLELKSQGSFQPPLSSNGAAASPPLTITREVTAITYNVPINAAQFQFTPPANARVMDERALPLAEVRRRVNFPVFIPTTALHGLRAELPYLRDDMGQPTYVEVFYHTADGRVLLAVMNMAASPANHPYRGDQMVTLANGISAYLATPHPQCWPENGDLALGWEQDGTQIVLSAAQDGMGNAAIPRDELLKIAASMSRTDDLPATEARPPLTPAVLPSPPPTAADCADWFPIALPTGGPPVAPLPTATPPPTASTDQMSALLATWARQADYPIFVPAYIPDGLNLDARRNEFAPNGEMSLRYAARIALTTPPGQRGSQFDLTVQEHPASYNEIAGGQGERITLAKGRAWLWRNIPNLDGSPSVVTVLRDGVLIRLSSSIASADELVRVADSLTPVPGGHAPLPDPAPFTLAEIRAQLSIPVFVPTNLPADFVAEPPLVFNDSFPGENFATRLQTAIALSYHHRDGRPALWVKNSMVNITYSGNHPDRPTLPNGITASYVNTPASQGGPTLQWQQDGVHLTISGPEQTRDSLLQIAANMSSTFDPNAVELPARPFATPAPPTFALLRPQWLPNLHMSVAQQDADSAPLPGGDIFLIFDNQPVDPQPHVPLVLHEIQRGVYAEGLPDARARQETAGGQAIWVSHDGDNCTQLSWTQNNVDLTLKNSYSLQAQPRYSCDQLRQIVAAVRLG